MHQQKLEELKGVFGLLDEAGKLGAFQDSCH